ncbi:hypothetical protein T458_24140 [Brevibacillus panacihumi W25]|uniref:Uncharacterized protein n=1 Tax=Brevibacillus panacihumi W25 TaxID=1408254 RepID=V6M0F7_9BACL|nr:hypothetical protein [Brevibacillus panacihumi]EST52156.1 hypothetical protein T458_24140 [Brevibacillus panacihumi W25]
MLYWEQDAQLDNTRRVLVWRDGQQEQLPLGENLIGLQFLSQSGKVLTTSTIGINLLRTVIPSWNTIGDKKHSHLYHAQ